MDLTWRVHQTSPYWTMLEYLKSANFAQKRPRLIVWTFHEADLSTPIDMQAVWLSSAMKPADFPAKLQPVLGLS